jgi:tetratricopeptide (TPR) repeat protein
LGVVLQELEKVIPGFPFSKLNNRPIPMTEEEKKQPEPTTAEGNKELADIHISKGRVHQAITRYKKAARMDNDPARRTDLGDAYAFAELPLNALKQYRKAIKSHPKRPEAYFSLAEIYVRYGKWHAAVDQYARAVELAPDNAFYRYKLAHACAQINDKERAIEHLQVAVSLCPDDSFYRFELASLYAEVRRDDEAIAEMEQAVALCPEDDYYVARLGMLYARVGRLERAAETYREAIRLNPNKLAYRCLLADMYYWLGYETRAEQQYSEAEGMDDYEAEFVHRARRFTLGGSW